MVTTSASWWRRRWNGETPTDEPQEPRMATRPDEPADAQDLWVAIGHLPRRQRAVVVLRYLEDRTEADTASTLRTDAALASDVQEASRS